MTPTPLTRRCVRCWQELTLDEKHFPRTASKSNGFAFHCRSCGSATKRKVKLAPEWLPSEDGMVWT